MLAIDAPGSLASAIGPAHVIVALGRFRLAVRGLDNERRTNGERTEKEELKQADAATGSHAQPDWTPFALLMIDVQRSFWPSRRDTEFPDFAANVARLLAVCRAEGIEVIHLRARFAPDGSDWMPRHRLRGTVPCIAGTAGVETLPCARELAGETVFWKQTLDGFLQPALLG